MLIALLLAAATTFAPPENVALVVRSEEVRDDGRTVRRFTVRRRIVFARDASGLAATITALSAEADAPAAERARYRTAHAGLIGRPVRVHLDPQGRAVDVTALDAIWNAYVAGLPGAAAGPAGRASLAIAALPRSRRIEVLAAPVLALIAAPAERVVTTARPIDLAAPAPYADTAMKGTETVVADGPLLRTTVNASGRAAGGAAAITLRQTRTIEPATGLIVAAMRATTITGPAIRLRTVSTVQVTR